MTPIFTGIIENRQLNLDNKEHFLQHLLSLEGKRVEVVVQKQRRKRSIQQNRYYFGVVLQLIAEHTGDDPEDLHEALKNHFAPKHVVGNIVVPSGTRYLDTIDFGQFVEKVRRWAAEELGVLVPDPGDVTL